ncbi:uncharacterized protein LOC123563805 [Mercenaria mercenaria]|uniref:uncharacterized protein LOC123563805 n=1 Tax=Mercenaria mercenaria TaxID=6596 RepID=UPI00234E9B8B|nr:uncharacterized protein LOC123563805 [Mercenaria mercenaria]
MDRFIQALNAVNAYIHGGGDPNKVQDKETGNTFLHCAAKHNFKNVAEKLLEHGMNALAKNKDGKIALQIAIDKKHDDMSALIARNMKPVELRCLFGRSKENDEIFDIDSELINSNCDFTETLLAVLDSLKDEKEDGVDVYDTKLLEEDKSGKLPDDPAFNCKDHTVFHILAEKGHKEAINHHILRLMISHKWNEWARKKFVTNFVLYLLSLFSLTFSVAVGATSADVREYDTRLQHSRAVFEIVAYGFVIKAIVNEIIQVVRHRLTYCKQLLNWLELISAVLLLLVLPVRYINIRAHWYIFAVGYFLWVIKIFKYAVVFSETGAYAESLRTIFWRNFLPFSLLFCIVNLAFGGTFLLVLKGDGDLDIHDETSSMWGIWYVGLRTMIEAQPVVEYTGSEGYRSMGTIVMLMFMAMTIVVLLNILIAQLTETYHIIQSDAWKSVVVNRAWIIARLERNAVPCPLQCIQECIKHRLPVCLSRCLQGKENRVYERYLSNKDFKMLQKHSTPMEQISSSLSHMENKLVKTDLKIQTVKTRLRKMEEKLEKKLNDMENTLRSFKR